MTKPLDGKIALVTGGSRGIGRGIAVALARDGAEVIVTARTAEATRDTVELIRAEEAYAAHAFFGFNMGELFQLKLLGDAAWVTDEATGLDQELLGGVGISGTVVGPWRTIINLEIGKAVAGPDDGFTAFIAFLKLFS